MKGVRNDYEHLPGLTTVFRMDASMCQWRSTTTTSIQGSLHRPLQSCMFCRKPDLYRTNSASRPLQAS